jgi:hypothetical protein
MKLRLDTVLVLLAMFPTLSFAIENSAPIAAFQNETDSRHSTGKGTPIHT